jgi:hypothetical protein
MLGHHRGLGWIEIGVFTTKPDRVTVSVGTVCACLFGVLPARGVMTASFMLFLDFSLPVQLWREWGETIFFTQ